MDGALNTQHVAQLDLLFLWQLRWRNLLLWTRLILMRTSLEHVPPAAQVARCLLLVLVIPLQFFDLVSDLRLVAKGTGRVTTSSSRLVQVLRTAHGLGQLLVEGCAQGAAATTTGAVRARGVLLGRWLAKES